MPNGQVGWRWMFAAGTPPALLFFFLMFTVPESPRWLIKSGQIPKARIVLEQIGGQRYADIAIPDIEQTLSVEEGSHVGFRDLLEPSVARILALGIGLAVLQQWCGINVIFNYAQEVFAAAGYKVSDIMQTIVLTGVVNLLFTLLAIYTVDSVGRRKLMLFGTSSLAIIYIVLGAAYYTRSEGSHMAS